MIKGLSQLAQNKSHRNKNMKNALLFKCKFLIKLKIANKNWRFSSFLCGFLAATSLSAVPLYADENEFTTSASN